MNRTWKIILGITLFIGAASLLGQHWQIVKLTKENQIKDVQIMMTNDTATVYKTRSGQIYSKLKAVTIEAENLKLTLESMGIKKKDLEDQNIELSGLVQILRGQLESHGPITTPVHDTVYVQVGKPPVATKTFNWTNKHLFFWGSVYPTKIEADYVYKTEIISSTERVKGKSIVTVSLSDPNSRILTGAQIIITPTHRWWDHWYLYGLAGMAAGVYLTK